MADLVVIGVGFNADSETEGSDRMFELPVGQDELIRELADVNKNTVVTITSGGGVDVSSWEHSVAGIMELWYPGQEGGAAVAEILDGTVNPSGHLPISWEKHLKDNPSIPNYYFKDALTHKVPYSEGVFVGYRGFEKKNVSPMYPFGFGLSFTTFKYSNLRVEKGDVSGKFTVHIDVKNTGSRSGADIVQLYLGDPDAVIDRPTKELKGFQRVQLEAGETKTIHIELGPRAFTYYDVDSKEWRATAGVKRVYVGHSVAQIELTGNLQLASPLHIPVVR